MDVIISVINKYASIPAIIAAIYSAITFRRLTKELKIFSLFIFLSGIIELFSKVLWFLRINNYPLLHLYVVVGFLLQMWFYHEVLKRFVSKKLTITIGILFILFTIINSYFLENIYTFNSNGLTVQSIFILILSTSTYMLFLNDIVKNETDITLIKSLNWINSGLFIYYSSSLLIFFLGDFFTRNYSVAINQYTWAIHTMFLIVMYGCFMIGLNRNFKKT